MNTVANGYFALRVPPGVTVILGRYESHRAKAHATETTKSAAATSAQLTEQPTEPSDYDKTLAPFQSTGERVVAFLVLCASDSASGCVGGCSVTSFFGAF